MTAGMEKKEYLEAAQEAPADVREAVAEEAMAEETAQEAPMPEAGPAADSAEAPEEAAGTADAFRPDDVSEDGSPHGPLDLFGSSEDDEDEPKKEVPTFAAFHADDRKPGELDDEDEEEDDSDEGDRHPAAKQEEPEDEQEDEDEEDIDEDEAPMSLMGHLNELRRRLFRIVIFIILGFVAFYGVAEPLYGFLSEPLKVQLPEGSKLIYTSPAGAFFTYMKVALVASLLGTSPFTFYQLWAFIAPGLYKEEKRAVLPLAFFSSLFFIAGAAFCFFLVFPIAFKFFMGFATDTIIPMISVEEYLGFALKLLIAFGVVFEMPLFAFFLSRFGLLTPEFMRRQRRYAILFIFIVAAILTPPDVFSQCLMALPMLLLYEVSIYVTALSYREKKKRAAEDAEEENA